MTYRVGVDIGGTFTDFAVLDDANKLYTLKVFSTPTRPGQEVIDGLRALKQRYGIEPSKVSYFTHGTTVGVNTLIQRNGAKLCLFATQGFEDVLELARLRMPDVFSLFSLRTRPLIDRECVIGMRERILSDGSIETPLDEAHVRAAVAQAKAHGVSGIAVALINSYRNPAHEQRIKELIGEAAPELYVTCSSDIWAVIREYERTMTGVINAYVQPRMTNYLTSLQKALRDEGVSSEPQITKSNGGVMRAELGKRACVDVLLSGTASGVTGASFVAKLSGFGNIASLDIGGTSADVALIIDGKPQFGSGEDVGEFVLHVPSISVSSIGGGGGSIARVDDQGVLKSGPESAGSEPGPACYGRGGERPTTTDAFVVCGFLGQAEIAYGAVNIDRAKAETAIGTLAKKMNVDVRDAAESVIKVAVSGMYAGMSKVFARHGTEAKSFTLMPFGGGGPMIACFLARELGIETVLVPATPGVLSALGGLVSDTKNDFIQTVYEMLEPATLASLESTYATLAERAMDWLRKEQGHPGTPQLTYSADIRYAGQSFEIETPITDEWIKKRDAASIADAFHDEHQRLYDYCDRKAAVQVINARVVVAAANPKPDFPLRELRKHAAKPDRTVPVYYGGKMHDAGLFDRTKLEPGATIEGPAIVSQSDTTTCVLPGFTGLVDGYGNLILKDGTLS
ncbi:MAG: hydantoinase/oxoprolinase family protein [Rhizobiales bacterium]|nr:hydantoinase/oxoprolinase family protein [Hyphomicrobiales bacterium]